jgi:peptide chain release factor 2
MRRLSSNKDLVKTWRDLERKTNEVGDLLNLIMEEKETSLHSEIEHETDEIAATLNKLEITLMLNGEYDHMNAILAIHAGAGGTESQDWAEMLLRMYTRWAEKRKYDVEVLDISPGDEAGIKSATLEIRGDHVFGYAKSERGVHRLVRLSPYDADHARHTSFALTEVLPEVKETSEININAEDIKVDTFRSSGPGGQHMQKTSSAVRITHIPTGTIVICQNQRSQYQNKEAAMKILYARLLEKEREEKELQTAKLKGKRIDAGWGNQIRSYVLHPYKMVKDHRTEYETSDTTAVLDGEIDDFMIAYLRSKVGEI